MKEASSPQAAAETIDAIVAPGVGVEEIARATEAAPAILDDIPEMSPI